MPDPENAQVLTWVVQGGSFALLCVIVIYAGRVIIPAVMASYQKLVDQFTADIQRRDKQFTEALASRDKIQAETAAMLGSKFDQLGQRVDHLADAVDHLRTDLDSRLDQKKTTPPTFPSFSPPRRPNS